MKPRFFHLPDSGGSTHTPNTLKYSMSFNKQWRTNSTFRCLYTLLLNDININTFTRRRTLQCEYMICTEFTRDCDLYKFISYTASTSSPFFIVGSIFSLPSSSASDF